MKGSFTSRLERMLAQLEQAARDEQDTSKLVELTVELLDLCRAAQRSHLDRCHSEYTPVANVVSS